MIAVCLIRDQPHYRREAFVQGLAKAGKKVVVSGRPQSHDDWLVIWNRYGHWEAQADQWERDGGTVVVCENGYVGADDQQRQLYAIALHGHNGSGRWLVGGEDRFGKLGIEPKPWRMNGKHILICGQRGIGSRTMASPVNWEEKAVPRLKYLEHELRVRKHPGRHAPSTPLADDLKEAWACAVWSSSSGVKALIEGIPVLFDAPHWIAENCAVRFGSTVLIMDDDARWEALQRMSWAQWTVDEIASGKPFDCLKVVQ